MISHQRDFFSFKDDHISSEWDLSKGGRVLIKVIFFKGGRALIKVVFLKVDELLSRWYF